MATLLTNVETAAADGARSFDDLLFALGQLNAQFVAGTLSAEQYGSAVGVLTQSRTDSRAQLRAREDLMGRDLVEPHAFPSLARLRAARVFPDWGRNPLPEHAIALKIRVFRPEGKENDRNITIEVLTMNVQDMKAAGIEFQLPVKTKVKPFVP